MKLDPGHPALQHVESAKKLLEFFQKNPSLLGYEEFGFIRDFLAGLGVNIPAAASEKEPPGMTQEEEEEVVEEVEEESEEEEEEEEEEESEEEVDPEVIPEDTGPFPEVAPFDHEPLEDDFEKAGQLKMEAEELTQAGKLDEALEKLTQALLKVPSGLTYAKRADLLLKMNPKRPVAAIKDCTAALEHNPDSAKALKIRGKANRCLGRWEDAARDLRKACSIDFDEDTEALRRLVETHAQKIEKKKQKTVIKENKRKEKEKAKRTKAAKKAKEKAKRDYEKQKKAEQARSSMPGMGGMGGMPGMGGMGGMPPGMAGLMQDPEIMAGLQNPKIMAALQKMMSNPAAATSDPSFKDPEVAAFMSLFMSKMGGGMGATPGGFPSGMGGGMGGFPPSNGAPGGFDAADDVD